MKSTKQRKGSSLRSQRIENKNERSVDCLSKAKAHQAQEAKISVSGLIT